MKNAIIVGCRGQDGTLLSEHLIRKNYQVLGIDLNYLEATYDYSEKPVDITNSDQVKRLIRTTMPTEIYCLAALHHSSEDKILKNSEKLFINSYEINTFSLIYILEAIIEYSPKTRLFYASSSHIFGNSDCIIDDEKTPINPSSIYGITKASGLLICRYYRKEYSIFASCGILYNHESFLRTENFLSKKIITAAMRIKRKQKSKIVFGDLNAEADWGYAPDFVNAMHKILHLNYSDDFVIATGKKHNVSEFLEIAFRYLDLEWGRYVEEDQSILKRRIVSRVGNPSKLQKATGWKPSVDFKEMIKVLLRKEGAFD